mgnify:CR=1 FL=1
MQMGNSRIISWGTDKSLPDALWGGRGLKSLIFQQSQCNISLRDKIRNVTHAPQTTMFHWPDSTATFSSVYIRCLNPPPLSAPSPGMISRCRPAKLFQVPGYNETIRAQVQSHSDLHIFKKDCVSDTLDQDIK